MKRDNARRGSVAVCLTQNNMASEVEKLRKKQFADLAGNI